MDDYGVLLDGPREASPQAKKARGKKREDTRDRTPQQWRERKPAPSNGIYDHLAMVFRDAPVYVLQGAPLIAKMLRERVQADPTLTQRLGTPPGESKPRDEHVVQDLVEFMIKRFWATVPNDQRADPLRTFLKDEWWIPLAEESVNHQRLLRIDDAPSSPGGPAAMSDPFYDDFMKAKQRHPAGKGLPLRERLALARAHHEQESN